MVFTIGHSTRSWETFVEMLQREEIAHLVDVRRFPLSRRHPHFNGDRMAIALGDESISYTHEEDLGGRRTAGSGEENAGWRNSSFRGYADHMFSTGFRAALERVIAAARETRVAIMCAEAVPWRCHRQLIADALVARGVLVRHILDASTKEHALTSFACVVDGQVRYPAVGGQRDLFGGESAGPD